VAVVDAASRRLTSDPDMNICSRDEASELDTGALTTVAPGDWPGDDRDTRTTRAVTAAHTPG
jgi:hypothetical protein